VWARHQSDRRLPPGRQGGEIGDAGITRLDAVVACFLEEYRVTPARHRPAAW
jgi:hypothetical protein